MKAETPAQRALASSAVSLLVAGASLAMFLPPLVARTVESPWRVVLFGVALGAGLLLHWVYLALAARAGGRSVIGWVALSVLLCPLGSLAALVLLGWLRDEQPAGPHPA